jgi:hypothetical protein
MPSQIIFRRLDMDGVGANSGAATRGVTRRTNKKLPSSDGLMLAKKKGRKSNEILTQTKSLEGQTKKYTSTN